MPLLSFTLSEEGVAGLRDSLNCLNKFNEEVCLEARKDQFAFTAINSTKSGYAYFSFTTNKFFSKYKFDGVAQSRNVFFCTLYPRILISIFRSRQSGGDIQGPDRPTAIDKCDVVVHDGPNVDSRFIIKITFRNGCVSTHKLRFASSPPIHARFNAEQALYHWSIPSRTLRGVMEHFGPGAELLDINSEGDFINFLGFTEKSMENNTSIRGKPLRTSISIELDEFEDVEVEDELHIIVPVKDFRAIILHAGLTGAEISARYSTPGQPIKIWYHSDAINAEFLLMTVGERGSGQKTKRKRAHAANGADDSPGQLDAGSRRPSAPPSEPPEERRTRANPTPQPSAARANVARRSYFEMRPSQAAPPARTQRAMSESLFVPQEEDAWEPIREDDEDDEGRLLWDGSNRQDTNENTSNEPQSRSEEHEGTPSSTNASGLEPTQRLSDARRLGLFYDTRSY